MKDALCSLLALGTLPHQWVSPFYIFYIHSIFLSSSYWPSSPPSLFCAPGSITNTLHYLEQQDVISLGQNQGKSCVAEPQHKSAVPRMATWGCPRRLMWQYPVLQQEQMWLCGLLIHFYIFIVVRLHSGKTGGSRQFDSRLGVVSVRVLARPPPASTSAACLLGHKHFTACCTVHDCVCDE